MKLITKPSVYLVGMQTYDDEVLDKFFHDHEIDFWATDTANVAEKLCEVAGRLCYMSFAKPRPGGNKAYLGRIIESQHGSVLEHAVYNFIFTGVSRSLTHELVRHRIGLGFSQLSQRYVDESVAEYVVPPELQREVATAQTWLDLQNDLIARPVITPEMEAGLAWLESVRVSHEKYQKLAEYIVKRNTEAQESDLTQEEKTTIRKAARGAARSILPNATETKIFVTMNARAARHMIEMRCSRHADVEIRTLFGMVWEHLVQQAPNIFGDYTKVNLPDGTFEVTTPNRKV